MTVFLIVDAKSAGKGESDGLTFLFGRPFRKAVFGTLKSFAGQLDELLGVLRRINIG